MHWRLLIGGLLWCSLMSPLSAQTTRGALTGTVMDQSGGTVPGATVTVTKADTGTQASTVTSDDGNYTIPELPYGEYKVTIAMAGFRTAEAKAIISANQTTRLDTNLQIGDVTETIDVVATPAIRPDSVTVESNFTTKQILDLPLAIGAVGNSRSPETFTFLTPGVSGNTFLSRVNGGQRFSNDVLVDGASTYRSENGPAFDETAPSVEALGEFTIKTNNFSAEYGATGSSITSFAYRSGTNQLHGSVYDFVRRTPLNAAGFYDTGRCTINGEKVTDGRCNDRSLNPERRPALDQKDDFGFTLGGPAYLPGIYDGRDRTFWFASFERYDQANQFPTNPVRFPTARQLTGDFSELLNRPSPIVIHDPLTGQPFPGNVIPQDRISPISRYALQFFPTPNTVNPSTGLQEWFVNGVPLELNSNLLTFTGDHTFTDEHKVHGSYSYRNNFRTRDPSNLLPLDNPLTEGRQQRFITHYVRTSYDWTLTPTLLNHLNIGVNRTYSNNGTVTVGQNFVLNSGLQGVANTHTPTQRIAGYATLGNQEFNRNIDNSYQISEDMSWIRGNHSMKFGVSFHRQLYNPKTQNNGAGTFEFSPAATSSLTGQGGDAFASYLLGAVETGGFWWNLVNPGWRRLYTGFYFQDDFKLRPNITLNLGLRYEISDPRTEVRDRTSSFDPNLANPAANGIPGALAFASDNSRDRFDDRYWNGLGPRVGISYAPDNRTVVRTGFGIYYSKVFYGDFGEATKQGFDAQPNFSSPDGRLPAFYWQNGVPQGQRPPFLDPSFVNGQNIDYIIEDGSRPARTYNWNLGVEREIIENLVVNVAYVGNSAQNLNRGMNFNQLDPSNLALGDLLFKNITDPEVVAAGYTPPYENFVQDWGEGATLGRALRPFPQYQDINVLNMTDGHSNYHSLQVKSEKRWSNDLQFLVAYTFSKTFTNSDSRLTWLSTGFQNDRLNQLEKSVSIDDQTHVAAISFIYDLPIGPGKRFLGGNGIAGQILGGWQVSGILQYQSGTPLAVFARCPSIEFAGAGGCRASYASTQRGDSLYGPGADGRPDPSNGQPYINSSAFVVPGPFQYGTTERAISQLRGFGYKNENLSVFKSFQFTEQVGLQIRFETFNLFNRVIFNNPDLFLGEFDPNQPNNTAPNPNFGFFSGQLNTPRVIQLAMKVLF